MFISPSLSCREVPKAERSRQRMQCTRQTDVEAPSSGARGQGPLIRPAPRPRGPSELGAEAWAGDAPRREARREAALGAGGNGASADASFGRKWTTRPIPEIVPPRVGDSCLGLRRGNKAIATQGPPETGRQD